MEKRLLLIFLLVFLNYSILNTQQTVLLTVSAQPLQVFNIMVDGTDHGWGDTRNEFCNLGLVDARGTPIFGAPPGDPDVNGVGGIPVDSEGRPLSSPEDPACIGSFYPLFSAEGGNSGRHHPNSAISVWVHVNAQEEWNLTVRAELIRNTQNVTIDQLKWKDDLTPSNGFQGYTSFSNSETFIMSGRGTQFIYHDYGLLVEYEDGAGRNVWRITYTLTPI